MANTLDFNEKNSQQLEAAEMAKKSVDEFMDLINRFDPISKVQLIDQALEELSMRDGPVAKAATTGLLKERQDLEEDAKRQAEESDKRDAKIKQLEKEKAESDARIAKLEKKLAEIAKQKDNASKPKPPVPDRSTKPKFTERVEARRAELANQEISK